MPFTVSHAAAILPLRKLNLISSAFIVGSMAPDFPYVIGNTDYRGLGHQFPGLIQFTLPASLAALWVFHNIIKRPMIGLLPATMQTRLRVQNGDFSFGGISRLLAILGSISLGIASHVLWDSFTHAYTWPWRRFAWLRGWMPVPLVHHRLQVCSVLQYISTIAGLLALAIWVMLWYLRSAPCVSVTPKPAPKSRFGLAVAMFVLAAVVGSGRAVLVIGAPANVLGADHFLLVCGVTSLAVAFWQLLLYCVLVSSYQVWTIP